MRPRHYCRGDRVLSLFHPGLTNSPNLVGMPALNSREIRPMTIEPRLAEAFGLPKDTGADALVAHARAQAKAAGALRGALGLAADADLAKAAEDAKAGLAAMRSQLKLAEDAGLEAIVTAAQGLGGGAATDAVIAAMQAELIELRQDKIRDRVDKLCEEGKVLPAQREEYVALATENPALFERMAAKLAPKFGNGGTAGNPPPADRLTDDERAVAHAMSIPEDKFLAARRALGQEG
jgi:hypothetical protein